MISFIPNDPLACYDPYSPASHPPPEAMFFKQSLFYTHTAPHIVQMHSHEMIELMQKKGGNQVPMSCPDARPPAGPRDGFVRMFRSVPGRCFILVDRPDRCNGTPYWIMRTDKSIIPDHGTIFTGRFLDFLINFFPLGQPTALGLAPAREMHPRMTIDPAISEP